MREGCSCRILFFLSLRPGERCRCVCPPERTKSSYCDCPLSSLSLCSVAFVSSARVVLLYVVAHHARRMVGRLSRGALRRQNNKGAGRRGSRRGRLDSETRNSRPHAAAAGARGENSAAADGCVRCYVQTWCGVSVPTAKTIHLRFSGAVAGTCRNRESVARAWLPKCRGPRERFSP